MKKYVITLLAVTALGWAACKKSSNNTGTSGNYTRASLSALAPAAKTVTLDAATGGSFYGNSGARYIIPPNAFKNTAGTIVTGNVQLTATEYLKKSDMIVSGILPITALGSLMSGGETNLNATQDGAQLYMAPGKTYQVNLPQPAIPPAGMLLFTGFVDSTNTGLATWKPDTGNSIGRIVYNGDTLQLLSDSLHLCNADAFLSSPSYQTFTVTASIAGVTLPDSATFGYTLYDSFTGVWPLGFSAHLHSTAGVYSETHVPNIPVHFAIYTFIDGTFYAGIAAATPATGSNYTVSLTATTPAAFKAQLDAL